MATSLQRKPFLCRTNLHHTWESAHTDDGQRYVRCSRCLKLRDAPPSAGVASGLGGP